MLWYTYLYENIREEVGELEARLNKIDQSRSNLSADSEYIR